MTDAPRTTEERYTTAVTTSNLRCDTHDHASIGDVDVLIAAGWSQSRTGAALLRLASEYDSAARAGHGTRMDAAMFVGKLRTLPKVRIQIAMQLAAWKVDDAHEAALLILAWWLHKVCGKCHGRGYDVVPGTARLSAKSCRSCDGSRESRIPCGDVGLRAANWLDECIMSARHSIRGRLGAMMGR